MPNVLLVAGRMRPSGTAVYTLNLVRGLIATGQRVLLLHGGGDFAASSEDGVAAEEVEGLGARFYNIFAHLARLRRIASEKWDVLHVTSDLIVRKGAAMARRLRLPAVVTFHHLVERPVTLPSAVRRVIAVSEAIRESLVNQARLAKDRIRVIPSGVDIETAEERCGDVGGHTPVVGVVGRLTAEKGVDYFLRAAAVVAERGPECHFLVAGGGADERKLRALARELGIEERVTFLVRFRSQFEVLSAVDVLVLPSLREGYGQIVLEAMACGRATVSTAVGAVPDFLEDGVTGLLVPQRDPEAMAAAIEKLLRDEDLRRRIGRAGKALVRERFGLNSMVTQTVQLYDEVLGEAG